MIYFIVFLIFFGALLTAGHFAWTVPRQQEARLLTGRLRELRARSGARTKAAPDLLRREQRGALAFLGDFLTWVAPLRRLQEHIQQADLKYRAPEVASLCILIAAVTYGFF